MLTRRTRSSRSLPRAGAARGASRHLLSLLSLGIPLAVFAQGLVSCGSDDGDAACEAGTLRACAGPEMCAGEQTCLADESGYSECSCDGGEGTAGVGGAGAGGSANAGGGAAGAAGASGGPAEPLYDISARVVGLPCSTDADCPAAPNGETPLVCMTSTSDAEFGTGAPQGGYCTAVCENSAQCQALDGLTGCGLIDQATGQGRCIGLCLPGGGQNAIKCVGADEQGADRAQACFAFPDDPTLGACFPVCQSDAACGNGRFCDFGATGLGLCTATEPPGGEVGAPCTEATAAEDCKSGICLTLLDPDTDEPAGSFCSATCTFGLVEGCGFGADNSVPREAVCLQPQEPTGSVGDAGFCFELCDVDADCEQDGWICADELTPEGQALVGRTGQCVPPSGGAVVGDAGAD